MTNIKSTINVRLWWLGVFNLHIIIDYKQCFLNRSYAYFIEVSVDQKHWVRVIDHSNYFCRSWQNLYFEPRVVQFIKVVGTSNTVNKVRDRLC